MLSDGCRHHDRRNLDAVLCSGSPKPPALKGWRRVRGTGEGGRVQRALCCARVGGVHRLRAFGPCLSWRMWKCACTLVFSKIRLCTSTGNCLPITGICLDLREYVASLQAIASKCRVLAATVSVATGYHNRRQAGARAPPGVEVPRLFVVYEFPTIRRTSLVPENVEPPGGG